MMGEIRETPTRMVLGLGNLGGFPFYFFYPHFQRRRSVIATWNPGVCCSCLYLYWFIKNDLLLPPRSSTGANNYEVITHQDVTVRNQTVRVLGVCYRYSPKSLPYINMGYVQPERVTEMRKKKNLKISRTSKGLRLLF